MFSPHTIKDGYSPYPSFCCWCIKRNIFFQQWPVPCPSWAMAQSKQTFIIYSSQIQQDATWNFLCTCHQMGVRGASKHSVKTFSPRRLKKLLFHRALEGIWEQFFILAAKQWNFCFQLHLSLLLFQQTIKAELKGDWGKNCHKTFLHWLRGSRESHRSFPPVFSAVFLNEDNWYLFSEMPLCFLTLFTGVSWSGGGWRDLPKAQPGWALSDKGGEPHSKMLV